MEPILSHTLVTPEGEPARWIYVLHGIYGSGRNWGSLARRLVEERPDWGVVLVDLRLHGGSLGFAPPHTLRRCADDLAALETHLGVPPDALLGHSFGGKVALVHAPNIADRLRQVWVVDSTLRVGAPAGDPWRIISVVRSLPETFESRDQLADALVEHGYPRGVGLWLAMNLERGDGIFRWRLDWEGVEEMLGDYFATDVWPVVEDPPADVEVHVVRALESPAVDADAVGRIEEAARRTDRVHLHEIAGGHWVNVDNPDAVLALLADRLPASRS